MSGREHFVVDSEEGHRTVERWVGAGAGVKTQHRIYTVRVLVSQGKAEAEPCEEGQRTVEWNGVGLLGNLVVKSEWRGVQRGT